VYDGVCNLCVGAVRFLSIIDRKYGIEYVPYQSLSLEATRRYNLSPGEFQGRMHMIEHRLVLKGAVALAETCRLLAPVTVFCGIFDTSLAQKFYDFIARRRYRLFGCRDTCHVPGLREARR
jgi:predicted DCC family thiol-disulfide oxidoreductase YuxK